MQTLAIWEDDFEEQLLRIDSAARLKAGTLRNIIPARAEWDAYLALVRSEWSSWYADLLQYPSCLVVLYDGLAFFEYESNRFWKQFAKILGKEVLAPNQQSQINHAYEDAAEKIGLMILRGKYSNDYNGSAIHHVGIPISFWETFLEICDWASWQKDWETLSGDEWNKAVARLTGGKTRLRNILIENHELATFFIKEVFSARQVLRTSRDLSANELAKACFLRLEYFYDVPETAEFLNYNSEIFLKDKARLFWDDIDFFICLNLPTLHEERLPAKRHLDNITQPAISTPSKMILNSKSRADSLELRLESAGRSETQKICGLNPWGLFDLNKNGYHVNSNRDQLPLHRYLLVSHEKLNITIKGFGKEEESINRPTDFPDGTCCYSTELMPDGKFAEITIKVPSTGDTKKLRFRSRSTIETAFFVGKKQFAAHFKMDNGVIKTDSEYPIIAVSVPSSYFEDIPKTLEEKFKVFLDDSAIGRGRWRKCDVYEHVENELYEWYWQPEDRFVDIGHAVHGTVTDLRNIHKLFKPLSLRGNHKLSLVTPLSEFSKDYNIYGVGGELRPILNDCWVSLPGSYLIWFLLCQSVEGMTWEELMLANDLICPQKRISSYVLRKYEKHGFVRQRGQKWEIVESHASIKDNKEGEYELDYCGDPSIIWGLYRHVNRVFNKDPNSSVKCNFPNIDILGNKRGEVPYLEMVWTSSVIKEVEKYLRGKNVVIGESLWTP